MGDDWIKAAGQMANSQTATTRTANNDVGHALLGGFTLGITGGAVPALDQLLADINSTRPPGSQVKSFYQSTVMNDISGKQVGSVTFTDASAVALMSDSAPKTADEPLPTRNLTFANFKSSAAIPILFQSFEFSLN